MSSDAASDSYASADGYLQRAQLLAELGRYDEAAAEIGYAIALDPADVGALTLLAQVHLAAEHPAEALSAAQAAVSAGPGQLPPLVVQALALIDLRSFAEAARIADQILASAPDDAYGQRSAAAILAHARNGQPALNAAWRGVELAPEEPQAHLVLGLVAAQMHLFDLAERAYGEALRLDPRLAEARHDMGVIRLEQRRYAEALEHLAEAAAMRPARVEPVTTMGGGLRRLVVRGARYCIVAALMVAFIAAGNPALSRIAAALLAAAGFVIVWGQARQLSRRPGGVTALLRQLPRTDRRLAVAGYALAAAPCLILAYAFVGTPWILASAIAATAVARIAVITRW